MAYVLPADFRSGTAKWFTRGILLTTTEAPDPDLTDAIAAYSEQVDLATQDHFEPEPGGSPEGTMTVDLEGVGGVRLYVPKRIRSITQVATRRTDGSLVVEDVSVYRVTQSLVGGVRQAQDVDHIDIVPDQYISTYRNVWPLGPQAIRLTGTFSWPATPERIKRAVALLVWDHFKPQNPNLRRADAWTTEAGSFHRAPSEPTGIPEVDDILRDYSRDLGVAV